GRVIAPPAVALLRADGVAGIVPVDAPLPAGLGDRLAVQRSADERCGVVLAHNGSSSGLGVKNGSGRSGVMVAAAGLFSPRGAKPRPSFLLFGSWGMTSVRK